MTTLSLATMATPTKSPSRRKLRKMKKSMKMTRRRMKLYQVMARKWVKKSSPQQRMLPKASHGGFERKHKGEYNISCRQNDHGRG